jgi:GT2 family glycosyltransferase
MGSHNGGWGEDVSVTLLPTADAPPWDATLRALAETLTDGFAGALRVIGDRVALERATEQAAAAGVEVQPVAIPAGWSFARRARAATDATDQSVQVFVTAPAVPLPGWLPSILTLFSDDRDPGVVGTRIVSPYGALEEAGGILAPDGSRRRRGEGDHHPDRPQYRFVQRVNFCSPPLLATRSDLFERLAGFDERRVAPTDAVVDFSLRAGRSGAPVYYQPQARVVTIGEETR